MNEHAPAPEPAASHAEPPEDGGLGLPAWPYYVYRERKVSGTTTMDLLTGPSRGVAVEVNAHTNFRWIRPINPRMNINTLGDGPVKAVIQSTGDRLSAHSSDEATVLGHMRRPGSRELLVAIKIYDPDQNYDEEILMRELPLWVSMCHPRILPLVGVCMWPGNRYAAAMPYMPGRHIIAYLEQHPHVDRPKLVAEGLRYLHVDQHIVHGSISPKAVLITGTGEAVLRDFSFSTPAVHDSESATATWIRRCFQLPYSAPEILLDEAVDSDGERRSKTCASDVYAFGMLIYEVLTGRAVWADRTPMQMAVEVTNGRVPPRPETAAMSDSLWSLCEACWARDPSRRPAIASVLSCLQNPDLSLQEVVDALNPRDVSFHEESNDDARSTIERPLSTDHDPDDPRNDIRHVPGDSPNPGSIYSCASWASTPRRASSLMENLELVEETLQVDIDGRQVDIVLPRQRSVRGGSGEVRKGYADIDGATRAVAVKVCRDRKVMPREYAIWKSLSHENILRLCGALDWTSPQRKCVFVSPFMKNGSLDHYLKLNALCERLPLMIDVATGLAYLHHTKELVHGDIKAENILISDDGHALLADFGLSTTVAGGAQATGFDTRQLYTLAYCAPEIVDDEAEYPSAPGVKRSKTKMSDMYAFGVLLYQTYAGGLARSQGARIRLMAAMYEGQFPPRPTGRLPVLCDDLGSICTRCWARVATDRPPIADVLFMMRELASDPDRQMLVDTES